MTDDEKRAWQESNIWMKKVGKKQGILSRFSRNTQRKINKIIPEKVHAVLTESIKNMVKITLTTNEYLSTEKYHNEQSLIQRELTLRKKEEYYKKLAAVEGAGTGAGGIFLGLADFPLLLAIKMKFLFEVGAIYGFDSSQYRERMFILYIFHFAFCNDDHKEEMISTIINWDKMAQKEIDWRKWQQDYRDYIDLVKLFQLLPGVGAVVGAVANYHLLGVLSETAKHCYRIRLLSEKQQSGH